MQRPFQSEKSENTFGQLLRRSILQAILATTQWLEDLEGSFPVLPR